MTTPPPTGETSASRLKPRSRSCTITVFADSDTVMQPTLITPDVTHESINALTVESGSFTPGGSAELTDENSTSPRNSAYSSSSISGASSENSTAPLSSRNIFSARPASFTSAKKSSLSLRFGF